ncbi:gamma-glutamyltransferase [Flavobacteriaceae bacterium F89]|uniref:Glutathione hydrolase proenzyme n=1 Tax=Cerina litoralis TaxID=2874477 RepID=A0AAE3JRJ1_9FLAO|nr:gamma-glutamyltransferase [Cerina litoralis]MCG2461413.1 gamma-glutamyltransferase [Cerina litoralis]
MKKTIPLLLALTFILFTHCKTKPAAPTGLVSDHAMVVSAREEASRIGSEIMQKGGNAFDAMVGTQLALAVAYPIAGNIGGGGFMVYRKSNGDVGALDYREKAPKAATKNMYLDTLGNVIPGKSTLGANAIGVPGSVAGILAVHQKFGALPLSEIMAPVIRLAEKGVVVTERQAHNLKYFQKVIVQENGDSTLFAKTFHKGDTIKYPVLAKTLRNISENGRDGFYTGETARKLAAFIQGKGGLVTEEDLEAYEAVWRQPIIFNYRDIRIISMSPPSSGGVTMEQILRMMEPFAVGGLGHNTEKYIQLFSEAAKRAYADRNYFLGDPDFVSIPLDVMLSKAYLDKRMENFTFDHATPESEISHGDIQISESTETTHYSIVDAQGNAVAVTTTINGAYGSKVYCDELGFFLNNEMDDFSAKPGVPNMFGLVGAQANSIAPQKRMLSSMTPTIVEKEGQLWMVVGTPGGSTIITAVAQAILNAYEFNMSMQQAVNAPRFHHQGTPDELILEPEGFSPELIRKLTGKGYDIQEKNNTIIGKVDAIRILPDGRLEGGADKRGDDAAVGY